MDDICKAEITVTLDRWTKLAPATINRALGELNGCLSWWMRQVYLDEHPIKSRVERRPVDNLRTSALTVADAEKIRAACPEWMRDHVRVAYSTGHRPSE